MAEEDSQEDMKGWNQSDLLLTPISLKDFGDDFLSTVVDTESQQLLESLSQDALGDVPMSENDTTECEKLPEIKIEDTVVTEKVKVNTDVKTEAVQDAGLSKVLPLQGLSAEQSAAPQDTLVVLYEHVVYDEDGVKTVTLKPVPPTSITETGTKRKIQDEVTEQSQGTSYKKLHIEAKDSHSFMTVELPAHKTSPVTASESEVKYPVYKSGPNLIHTHGAKLACPFRRTGNIQSLHRGTMVNKEKLMMLNMHSLFVCPLCVQRCCENKETTYEMLSHIALHKGVQNLHCVCSDCGKYMGRFMDKADQSTFMITDESYFELWKPGKNYCDCDMPRVEVMMDITLDVSVFKTLVIRKLDKQPNARIELFDGNMDFMKHLLNHEQVLRVSPLCNYCKRDPRNCHYRVERGEYFPAPSDLFHVIHYHQGEVFANGPLFCRLVSKSQDGAATEVTPQAAVSSPGSVLPLPQAGRTAVNPQHTVTPTISSKPLTPPARTRPNILSKMLSSASKLTTEPTTSSLSSRAATAPGKPALPSTSVSASSKTSTATHTMKPASTSAAPSTSQSPSTTATHTLKHVSSSGAKRTITIYMKKNKDNSEEPAESTPREVKRNMPKPKIIKMPAVHLRVPVANTQPYGLHTHSGLGLSSQNLLESLDSLVMPFTCKSSDISNELRVLHSCPKLRCPAYKNGCRFASWHLKLMDAHIKAHLLRVKLLVMFRCFCRSYYHNLFDMFLHIQERHTGIIGQSKELSSFPFYLDESEEKTYRNRKKNLQDLLFKEEREPQFRNNFESNMWVSKVLVSSGFIWKMYSDAMRTTWLESATDVENWMREELHSMQLYEGKKCCVNFDDIPLMDAQLMIPTDQLEEDSDRMWAMLPGHEEYSRPFTLEEMTVLSEPQENMHMEEEDSYHPQSIVQVIAPLIPSKVKPQLEVGPGLLNMVTLHPNSWKEDTLHPWKEEKRKHRAEKKEVAPPKIAVMQYDKEERKEKAFNEPCDPHTLLPTGYKLPRNVNQCEYVEITDIFTGVETGGKGHVKVLVKEVDTESYHQCPYCNTNEDDIFSITRHISNYHEDHKPIESVDTVLGTKMLLMLCRHCDFVTFDKLAMWLHFQNVHGARMWLDIDDVPNISDGYLLGVINKDRITALKCGQCELKFETRRAVVTHMLKRYKPSTCAAALLGFIRARAVTSTEDVDLFICVVCFNMQESQAAMERHVCINHSHPRLLYICMYCDKYNEVYFTRSLLMTHRDCYHANSVPLWCSVTLLGYLDPSTIQTTMPVKRDSFPSNSDANPAAFDKKLSKYAKYYDDEPPKSHAGFRLPADNADASTSVDMAVNEHNATLFDNMEQVQEIPLDIANVCSIGKAEFTSLGTLNSLNVTESALSVKDANTGVVTQVVASAVKEIRGDSAEVTSVDKKISAEATPEPTEATSSVFDIKEEEPTCQSDVVQNEVPDISNLIVLRGPDGQEYYVSPEIFQQLQLVPQP